MGLTSPALPEGTLLGDDLVVAQRVVAELLVVVALVHQVGRVLAGLLLRVDLEDGGDGFVIGHRDFGQAAVVNEPQAVGVVHK